MKLPDFFVIGYALVHILSAISMVVLVLFHAELNPIIEGFIALLAIPIFLIGTIYAWTELEETYNIERLKLKLPSRRVVLTTILNVLVVLFLWFFVKDVWLYHRLMIGWAIFVLVPSMAYILHEYGL